MLYEGPCLANQNNRKLVVFHPKFERSNIILYCFCLLLDMGGNEAILLKECRFHSINLLGIRMVTFYLDIIDREDTLKR